MEFTITTRSSDPNVAYEIDQVKIEGITIKREKRIREIVNPPIDFLVYVGEHVVLPIVVSLFARKLYDILKKERGNQLKIDDESVEINAEKIEQVIINLLKKEDENK